MPWNKANHNRCLHVAKWGPQWQVSGHPPFVKKKKREGGTGNKMEKGKEQEKKMVKYNTVIGLNDYVSRSNLYRFFAHFLFSTQWLFSLNDTSREKIKQTNNKKPQQKPQKTNQQKVFSYLFFWVGFVLQDSYNFLFVSFFLNSICLKMFARFLEWWISSVNLGL